MDVFEFVHNWGWLPYNTIDQPVAALQNPNQVAAVEQLLWRGQCDALRAWGRFAAAPARLPSAP